MRERLDLVEALMEHEAGTLSPARELELFAHLIHTGQAWHLEDHYGQLADYLIEAGLITVEGEITGYGREVVGEHITV